MNLLNKRFLIILIVFPLIVSLSGCTEQMGECPPEYGFHIKNVNSTTVSYINTTRSELNNISSFLSKVDELQSNSSIDEISFSLPYSEWNQTKLFIENLFPLSDEGWVIFFEDEFYEISTWIMVC